MSTPTRQRSAKQRARTAQPTKSAKVSRVGGVANRTRAKQTARIEGLRDGKPLIFGWGGHLTRAQKTRYQHMAMWSFIGVIALAVVSTMLYGVYNENVLVPAKTIVSVNNTNISQDAYRKELAYKAQVIWNRLQSEITQRAALADQVKAGDATAVVQNSIVTTQLQTDEGRYAQSALTSGANLTDIQNNPIAALEANVLIMQGAQHFEQVNHVPASTFEPSQKEINDALTAFKKAFPKGETYAQFLSANSLSDADVINGITIDLRQTKMQTYLASTITSPSRQVHLRRIEVDTQANAEKIRKELIAGKLTDAIWSSLAKQNSLDTNSKDRGGDMGFTPNGAGDAGIELWAYAPDRKVDDLSPVIFDASSTYDVVQVLGIDPARTIDAATLKGLQDNALSHWLTGQRIAPSVKITTADSTMLTATRNLPKKPDLNATLPAITPTIGVGG